jgi:hypothetical protein
MWMVSITDPSEFARSERADPALWTIGVADFEFQAAR